MEDYTPAPYLDLPKPTFFGRLPVNSIFGFILRNYKDYLFLSAPCYKFHLRVHIKNLHKRQVMVV